MRQVPLALIGLLTVGLITGCSSSTESASSAGEAPAGAAAQPVGKAVTTSGESSAAVTAQRLIRTVEIVIEVDDLNTSAARVRQAAADLGGTVSHETTSYADAKPVPVDDTRGSSDSSQPQRVVAPGQSVIVLRVPQPDLDQAVDRVAKIGKELQRNSSSQDVTGDIADITSRVATQKASVARVRDLLAKASSLQDIVLLESELTKRQADLEAQETRLASLADRADLSTLTVVLQTPQTTAAEPQQRSSFLAGLEDGWHALAQSTRVLLTITGALLPFAAAALLIGWPLLVLARRRRRPAAPPPGTGPTPTDSST